MEQISSKDGTTLSVWISGHGPPLLLVHGTTADHTRWIGVAQDLERRFTVYAMDRRGRGGSGDAEGYRIEREAEDVAAVVEAVGESVAVLGHSYGAVCALEAALLTGHISKMVLYEPPIPSGLPMYPPGLPDRMQALLDGGEAEQALEIFMREVVRMPEHEFAAYRELPAWAGRIELAHTIPRELAIDRTYEFDGSRFADLDVRTLLLLGGDSPPLFQRAVALVDAALHNATLRELPGQQHIAMDTAPEVFLSEVVGFLDDEPPQVSALNNEDPG